MQAVNLGLRNNVLVDVPRLMVWLAKWIRENVKNSRVLFDRTELDERGHLDIG
jgi:hypothetical protein